MVPVRELPYRPAASDAASEAAQMTASDYVHYLQKPLASFGASTDGKQTLISLFPKRTEKTGKNGKGKRKWKDLPCDNRSL